MAARARKERVEVKSRLKRGAVTLSEVLTEGATDDVIGAMKVSALLESLPGVGKTGAKQIMERLGIAHSRRIRGLGSNQRAALVREFSDELVVSSSGTNDLPGRGAPPQPEVRIAREPAVPPQPSWPRDTRQSVLYLYLSGGQEHEAVESALEGVLDAFGLEIVQQFPGVQGSWFRKFLVQARPGAPDIEERTTKLAYALESRALGQSQAYLDTQRAEAVAKLLTALDKEANASIQIGSFLLVKVGGNVVVRELTQPQLIRLEENPGLFRDPETVLQQLQSVGEFSVDTDLPNAQQQAVAAQAATSAERDLPIRMASVTESRDRDRPDAKFESTAGAQAGSGNVQVNNYFYGTLVLPVRGTRPACEPDGDGTAGV
jgi:hypothetical protein